MVKNKDMDNYAARIILQSIKETGRTISMKAKELSIIITQKSELKT